MPSEQIVFLERRMVSRDWSSSSKSVIRARSRSISAEREVWRSYKSGMIYLREGTFCFAWSCSRDSTSRTMASIATEASSTCSCAEVMSLVNCSVVSGERAGTYRSRVGGFGIPCAWP